jgi:hypothetical protein
MNQAPHDACVLLMVHQDRQQQCHDDPHGDDDAEVSIFGLVLLLLLPKTSACGAA